MKARKRKVIETMTGAAVGAAVAGPVGAVAGGLVASKVDSGGGEIQRSPGPKPRVAARAEDSLIHARLRRILVPLDFSPPSERALRFAREWAGLFGAQVWLLHVVEPTPALGEASVAPPGAIQRDIPDKAKAALRELARAEFPASVIVHVIVRKGRAFDQIAAAAKDIRADLILIATHGLTGLKHMLLGSTAERVARHAPCPVLILRRRPSR